MVLPTIWVHFIDVDWDYTYPFYDICSQRISFNPEEKHSEPATKFIAYLTDKISPIIYIGVFMINPFNKIKEQFIIMNCNIHIYLNLWWLYFIFQVLRMLDMMLFVEQMPFTEYYSIVVVPVHLVSFIFLCRKYANQV